MHEPDHEVLKGCAVITGANRGIGKATAVVFAQNGFNLILTCRDKTQDFAKWCDQLAVDYKINVTVEVVNLEDLESIKDLIRRIAKNSSTPNVLVNNAGTAHGALVQLTPSKQILEMMSVNFFATLFLSQGLSRVLGKVAGSSIINVSSASALHPQSGMAGYGASKAAVNYLSKVMAIELEASGIKVFVVAPGVTETDMLKQVDSNALEALLSDSPTGRPSLPNEIAELIFGLTTVNSEFKSGDIIEVHGGEVTNVH